MKTAFIPPILVEPSLLAELDSVLALGETVEEFVEAAVRGAIAIRLR